MMETGAGIEGNIAAHLAPGFGAARVASKVPQVASLLKAATAARLVLAGMAAGAGSGARSSN